MRTVTRVRRHLARPRNSPFAGHPSPYASSPYKWFFLTAETEEERNALFTLINDGFKLPRGEDEEGDIVHSFYFVLVDRLGQIRGYYDGESDTMEGKLKRDIKRLLRKTPSPI